MSQDIFDKPIQYLSGVGEQRAELLNSELGIRNYGDLLHLFPNRYIDRTHYYKISELHPSNSEVQIIGTLTDIRKVEGKTKAQSRLVATLTDSTGQIELVWFRATKWFRDTLKTGVPYVVFGRLNAFNGWLSLPHPEMELLQDHQKSIQTAIQPVYPSTEKLAKRNITNRVMRKFIQQVFLETGSHFYETLPPWIVSELQLLPKSEALLNIHFPKNQELLARAQFRLKFEELFYIQLQLLQKNKLSKRMQGAVFSNVGDYFLDFYQNRLPFSLTGAQKRVIKEIRSDTRSGSQMNRLLQGDVGSGKTIVALMSMLLALDNGYQACLVAPTEILATQHFQSISQLLENTSVTCALLTGSTKASQRKKLLADLASGELQILVGTHAVMEDKVIFQNLGLAVIDEQHRFGVAQRSKLWMKNTPPPHVLIMSATPIPRTLAMSLYGDLDVSIIDELPPGRKPIKTVHRYENQREQLYDFVKEEIQKGRQVYVVYPLIEESETLDYQNLSEGYHRWKHFFPEPQYNISVVHGQLKPQEKDEQMQRFERGESQIMVATTVIEVGVNVPNASVMIIESAERFGLSQLHQLRGRVGRGAEQSYCILLTGTQLSNDSRTRMQTMTRTNDGFEIAEVDLKLRGPGDLMGTQQSGVLALKIADITKDGQILKIARDAATQLISADPNLSTPENQAIAYTLTQLRRHKGIWSYIA